MLTKSKFLHRADNRYGIATSWKKILGRYKAQIASINKFAARII